MRRSEGSPGVPARPFTALAALVAPFPQFRGPTLKALDGSEGSHNHGWPAECRFRPCWTSSNQHIGCVPCDVRTDLSLPEGRGRMQPCGVFRYNIGGSPDHAPSAFVVHRVGSFVAACYAAQKRAFSDKLRPLPVSEGKALALSQDRRAAARTGGAAWETQVCICCKPPIFNCTTMLELSPDLRASTDLNTAKLKATKWIESAVYRYRFRCRVRTWAKPSMHHEHARLCAGTWAGKLSGCCLWAQGVSDDTPAGTQSHPVV